MTASSQRSNRQTLSVLHPAFALTGILHAIGGPLLPSLAATFNMSDSQSGALLSIYFAGTSLGAFLCIGRYARLMTLCFLGVVVACIGIAVAPSILLHCLFFLLGINVGALMSAVSIYTGRRFAERSAAPLTFLNFSWSAGALVAPLLAARLLLSHTYRATYVVLAVVAALAALACWFVLDEPGEATVPAPSSGGTSKLRVVALFAFLTFLEVGVENTTVTWLATYSMRAAGSGAAVAAVSSSIYWWGFLLSRGAFAVILLRAEATRILWIAVATAAAASALLVGFSGTAVRDVAMAVLGAALAPIFPLLLSRFFARTPRRSDSRWVLALCGFGGSVLPWLTGWISGSSGSLRFGLAVIPAALFTMLCMLPALRGERVAPAQ